MHVLKAYIFVWWTVRTLRNIQHFFLGLQKLYQIRNLNWSICRLMHIWEFWVEGIFLLIVILNLNTFRNYIHWKKIIIIILSLCFICALILSFVYVHNDYKELFNFYRGYMGRRLLINEKRLVYREKKNKMKVIFSTWIKRKT